MSFPTSFLLITVLLLCLPSGTWSFGAGDIPDFSYLNDKAFRHGDIENILSEVIKNAGRAAGAGGLLGFAKKVLKDASGGAKFDKGDVKKVYFGNWLRDYSQAMDIAGLSKLSADTLVLVVSVLGFMTFGFATEEFEVTADRLGVYLPVEHIDNPKGYAEKEGDARQFHPKLRPPVEQGELEIDERNGMKKYMATENEGFDSSTAHIRRTFRACIEYGRRAGGQEGPDLYEAYRLLGTGLHTMEDLLAHSNWCEIALRKMGHQEVFCHVGDEVEIDTPNGRAPPLVTGTFGSADFLHSLMGEATDHLSQASVTALSQKMNDSKNDDASSKISQLKDLMSKLPIGGSEDDKMNQGEQLEEKSKAYDFDPNQVAPPEVQQQLLELLRWRDSVYREVLKKIEMVPGLSDLIEELTNALNAYVYTVIAPWLTPILNQATSVLGEGSKTVIDSEDQYEVFDNPRASDPSHSLLSKDHFGLILNEPAGKIAQIVVVYSTQLIVQAWADDNDPDRVIDQILEAFHHPYYATGQSRIQHQMFEEMEKWIGGLGPDQASETINALTKESVREGKNKRLGDEGQGMEEAGYGGQSHASSGGGRTSSGGGYGDTQRRNDQSGYGGRTESYGSGGRNDQYGSGRNEESHSSSYGGQQQSYSSGGYEGSQRREDQSHGGYGEGRQGRGDEHGRRRNEESHSSSYEGGRSEEYQSRQDSYSGGGSGRDRREEYGSQGYGSSRQDEYSSARQDDNSYGSSHGVGGREEYSSGGRRGDDSYGGGGRDEYGSSRRDDNQYSSSYGGGGRDENRRGDDCGSSYGGGGRNEYSAGRTDDNTYGSSGGGRNESRRDDNYGSSYGGSGRDEYSGGRTDDNTYGSSGGGREEYGGRQEGYNPGYSRDETFGAERMNIRDEGEEEGGYGRRRGEDEYGERREYGN